MSVKIDENDWHLELTDLKKPLARLDNGVALAVLACLGLNKIHITHHPEWPDCPRKKQTRKSKTVKQGNNENDDDSDDSTNSGNQPQRKRTRTVKQIDRSDPNSTTPSGDDNLRPSDSAASSGEPGVTSNVSQEQLDELSMPAPASDPVLDPLLEALA
ncbi:hypothetical protein PGTUg99_009133 [Puccinia graminis f. sp. tritici]|uniref:Uncharacterized protein n=1 Tax=Puccinia graminis f. sp. tritici TaxID=56615 RepID=A0A5B0S407_PUCGR|nr:hypothetical protein PGTUg99_009133 [Puccinia graminis f. sp. tritici]